MSESVPAGSPATAPAIDWEAVAADPRVRELVHERRRWISVTLAVYGAVWVAFLMCSAYAEAFMGMRVISTFTLGYLWSMLMIALTIAVAIAYGAAADRRFDPLAREIEQGQR